MGECSCSPKEKYFKVGDEIIYLEKWKRCEVCDAVGLVRLGKLNKEDYSTHCTDEKKLFKFPY